MLTRYTLSIFKMATVSNYWLANRVSPPWFKSCIFQQIWREACLSHTLGLETASYHQQHITYLARLLLNSLLSHKYDDALQCLVGLCGACKRTPELFWRTGCEVLMHNRLGSYTHVNQFIKNMFVICVPFQKELLLDFAMYLVKQNPDITEAQELLSSKLSHKSFSSCPLLRAYSGLFAYVSWKKSRIQLEKRDIEGEDMEEMSHISGRASLTNLKRQMDFHGKQALLLFGGLVEHSGVWDIFVTRQIEMLKYYNKNDDARKVLLRYKEKNPENPNAHRYLYYFLKEEKTDRLELCNVLEGLLHVDPTSELSKEYIELKMHETDQSKGLLDAVAAFFIKLDHAACQQSIKDWEAFAETLRMYFATHEKNSLGELWNDRSDWWPQYHFRQDLVPSKDHVSETDWQLAQYKADAATWLLGKKNPYTKAVERQESQDSSSYSDTASPRKRKRKTVTLFTDSPSPLKRKNKNGSKLHEEKSSSTKRKIL